MESEDNIENFESRQTDHWDEKAGASPSVETVHLAETLDTTKHDSPSHHETMIQSVALLPPNTQVGNSRIDLDEARFASIQRPEPLGKALADTHIGRIANLANQNGEFPSNVDDLYFGGLTTGYNKDLNDISDTGLQEQEYPARIPLSVFEGDLVARPLFKQTVISSELGVVKSSPQTATEQYGSATESQTSIFRNSDSNFETTSALASQDKSDYNKSLISKMFEPTYQSSVALLKELQRRKLRLSKECRTDEKSQSRPADPLILAENAVKASNILSSRTEKSLRRASLVLKAIEEHKTPPSNLYESSSFSASHVSSSLSVGMHSLSLSASTETKDVSDSKNSKDSVDMLIDKRLKTRQDESSQSNKGLTPGNSLLATLSGKRVSVNSTEASTRASTGPSTELSSLESDGSAKRDDASEVFLPNQDSLTRSETFADTKREMSSNFLQLEGLSAEDESNTALSVSARFQSQMDEFSPIDGERQLLRSNKYRASSRIRNSKSLPSEADESLLDSDVVKFHRSLGAGTVTPLLPAADVSMDSANQSKVSYFSTEGREAKGDKIPQRIKGGAHEDQSLSSDQVTLSRSDGTSDLVPSMQTDLSKDSNGDRNSNDVSSSSDSKTSVVEVSASNPRGIYDIRDSTGPGSSNRKRLISGKRPVSHKKNTRDLTSLYVSESEMSLTSMNGEQRKRATETEKRSFFNERVEAFHRNGSNSLSMSEYPFMSNSGQSSIQDKSQQSIIFERNELRRNHEIPHHYKPYTSSLATAVEEGGKVDRSEQQKNSSSMLDAFSTEAKYTGASQPSFIFDSDRTNVKQPRKKDPTALSQSRTKELNQLWDRFKRNFEQVDGSGRQETLEKIDILNELLIGSKRNVTPSVKKAERFDGPQAPISFDDSRKTRGNTSNIVNSQKNCPLCGKRSLQERSTSKSPLHGSQEVDSPLLLHMWTQTTPLHSTIKFSNAESKEVKFVREKPKVNDQVEYSTADKENFKEAKDSANIENVDAKISDIKKANPNPLSWNLVIKDVPKKTDRKCLPKKDLQVPSAPQRKKKEPVFTAWFQSTRSDASGGSVIPLSSVPNLAVTYRDNKPKAKVIIEKTTAKDTKYVLVIFVY